MEVTLTPSGDADKNGVVPARMGVAFEVTAVAEGHRREDGLTAAEVRQELAEGRAINGS